MLVFIDESGIHKKTDHSTFVLTYVAVRNYQKLEKVVKETEEKLGIKVFHWSQSIWKVKEKFFEAILKTDFSLKVSAVKNPVHPERELERLLPRLLTEKNIKTIFIDGSKPKWYARKMKKSLRDNGILVRKLKIVKDSQYAGVRVADMAAGLIRAYFDDSKNERIARLYKRLEKKILVVIE